MTFYVIYHHAKQCHLILDGSVTNVYNQSYLACSVHACLWPPISMSNCRVVTRFSGLECEQRNPITREPVYAETVWISESKEFEYSLVRATPSWQLSAIHYNFVFHFKWNELWWRIAVWLWIIVDVDYWIPTKCKKAGDTTPIKEWERTNDDCDWVLPDDFTLLLTSS